jgi:hypothetical protein
MPVVYKLRLLIGDQKHRGSWESDVLEHQAFFILSSSSDRNGNLKVPIYFLKAKQLHTARQMGKDECI